MLFLVWLSISIFFLSVGALLEYFERRRLTRIAAQIAQDTNAIAELEFGEVPKQIETLQVLRQRIDQSIELQRFAQSDLSVLIEEIHREGSDTNSSTEFAERSEAQSAFRAAEIALDQAKEQLDNATHNNQKAQKQRVDLEKELEKATARGKKLERDLKAFSVAKKDRAETEAHANRSHCEALRAAILQAINECELHNTIRVTAQERIDSAIDSMGPLKDRFRVAREAFDKKSVHLTSLTKRADEQKVHLAQLSSTLRDLDQQYAAVSQAKIDSDRALLRLKEKLRASQSSGDPHSEGIPTTIAFGTLHGWIIVLVFTCLTICFVVFCTVQPEVVLVNGITPARVVVLFSVLSGTLLLAFTTSASTGRFYRNLGVLIILYGPLIILVLFQPSVVIFTAMILVAFIASFAVAERGESSDKTGGIVKFLYVAWIVTGILDTVYKEGLFPAVRFPGYEAPRAMADALAAYIRRFDKALDVRYTATLLLLLVIIIKAIIVSFRQTERPRIRHLARFLVIPKLQSRRRSLLESFLEPFLITFNLIARFLHAVVDTLWYISATVAVYVTRIGKGIGNILFETTAKTKIWPNILRLFGCYVLVYGFVWGAGSSSESVLRYLREDLGVGAFVSIPPKEVQHLAELVIATLLGGVCYSWLFWPTENMRSYLHREAFGTAVGLVLYFSAGVVVYVLANTRILAIVGFDHLGPFTLFVAFLLVVFAVGQLLFRVSRRGQPS